MKIEGDFSEGRIPISCHAFKKPKYKGNSQKLGILLLCFLTMGLPSSGVGVTRWNRSPLSSGIKDFAESMILRQDLRMLAQAKEQKEETQESPGSKETLLKSLAKKIRLKRLIRKRVRASTLNSGFPMSRPKRNQQTCWSEWAECLWRFPVSWTLAERPR